MDRVAYHHPFLGACKKNVEKKGYNSEIELNCIIGTVR